MSQQESHTGKLRKIETDSVEKFCKEFMHNECTDTLGDYKNYTEMVEEGYETQFVIHKDNIYHVLDDIPIGEDDYYKTWDNNDGTVGYAVSFYNGGCGFSEAVQEALNSKNNEENKGK